jgi:hypothetical protein
MAPADGYLTLTPLRAQLARSSEAVLKPLALGTGAGFEWATDPHLEEEKLKQKARPPRGEPGNKMPWKLLEMGPGAIVEQ